MAGAEAAADIRVIVLVKEHVIAPVRVGGVAEVIAEARAAAFFIQGENAAQAQRELLRGLLQGEEFARSRWAAPP